MTQQLTFTVAIEALRPLVWKTMLDPEGYKAWTAPFCEGSYFEGAWDQGAKIRFMSPSGDGMTAVIAENRLNEYVSIRHLGEVSQGVEDTSSERVRAWAPPHENFAFADSPDGTVVTVTLDVLAQYEQYMKDTYPKALDALKRVCEAQAHQAQS